MRKLIILTVLCWVWGCGERPDEITPYVEKVKPLEKYHKTLVQYRKYLNTEGMSSQARDLRQVIENYKKDLETIGPPDDKFIRAAHNNIVRALAGSLTKLVQPSFPTFIPSANKQINRIEKAVKVNYYDPLAKEWEKARKAEPFPLKWPEE